MWVDPEILLDAICKRVQDEQETVIPELLADANQTWPRPKDQAGQEFPKLTELPPIISFERMADSNELAIPPVLTVHPLGSTEADVVINQNRLRVWMHFIGLQVFTQEVLSRQLESQLFAYTRLLDEILCVRGSTKNYAWLSGGVAGLKIFNLTVDRLGYGEPLLMDNDEFKGFGGVVQMRLRVELMRK